MKDLSNENVVHIKKEEVQYLQFRKLLEYKDTITHVYSIGTDVNFRTARANKEKWNIDTVLINKIILSNVGLKEENIIDSGICSICNKDLIHSFRAEKQGYGLNTALISLL